MPRTIAITGAPGWLGTTLAQALSEGAQFRSIQQEPVRVRCLVEPSVDSSVLRGLGGDVEVVPVDIRKAESVNGALDGCDAVVHAAGVIHPSRIRDLYDVNVLGTRHIIDEAIRAGVKRLSFISSNSPAGVSQTHTHCMREEEAPRPYFNYGESKLQAERFVEGAHRTGDLETVILRPCWFYGPNQPERQSRFFRMIQAGNPLVFGDGNNLRSMSYVSNTVQGVLLSLAVEQASGRTYWITDKRPYSFLEILETVADILKVKKLKPRFVPSLVSTACQVADAIIQKTGFYQKEIHVVGELASSIAVSVDRAVEELGYDPEIELEEGMRLSIEWCRKNGQL